MKPPPFAFRDPVKLADALVLLADDENACPLAGGQSLGRVPVATGTVRFTPWARQ